MKFANIQDLKDGGFEGFVTIQSLKLAGYRTIPDVKGVYMIALPEYRQPEFMEIYMVYKAKYPPRSISELTRRWISETSVVYIGKAGATNQVTTLRKRLRAYMQGSNSHSGGRAIWQLSNALELLVCWKPLPGHQEPAVIESILLEEFRHIYRSYPFANGTDRG